MTIKVGINGLGRIGRMIVRAITENKYKDIEIKHINNRSNSEVSCLLLKQTGKGRYQSPCCSAWAICDYKRKGIFQPSRTVIY